MKFHLFRLLLQSDLCLSSFDKGRCYMFLALLASTIFLTACTDDGDNGQNGLNSLIQQMPLVLGNDDCWSAGTRIESGLDKNQN